MRRMAARVAYRAFVTHGGRRGTPRPLHMRPRWIEDGWVAVGFGCRKPGYRGLAAYWLFVEQCRASRGIRYPGDLWCGPPGDEYAPPPRGRPERRKRPCDTLMHPERRRWKSWAELTDQDRDRWDAVADAVEALWNRIAPGCLSRE